MIITQAITAGTWFEYYEQGDFFRILTDSASTTFDVEFYNAGKEVVEAVGVKAGYSERFIGGGFDRIKIRATVNATVQFVIRLGNVVGYDIAPTGNVSVSAVLNNFQATQVAYTAINTNLTVFLENINRKFLLVQNKHDSGNVWVNFAGAAATQANGIKIGPGDSISFESACPYGPVNIIGDIATNSSIVVMQG